MRQHEQYSTEAIRLQASYSLSDIGLIKSDNEEARLPAPLD